jgi:hypothetical protein
MLTPVRASLSLAALLLALAPPVLAGVTTQGPAPAAPAAAEPRPVHGDRALQLRCWQEGVKIVDQGALAGLSLNAVTKQRSVGFKRQGDSQPTIFLLPFADSLCLIQPEPPTSDD